MNELIAYCGLNCEKCDARIATVTNDEELRKKTARLWSDMNNAEITEEMINCTGCRTEGPKTPYCDHLCPIRKCATEKGYSTCGDCAEIDKCEKVAAIIGNNDEARRNLMEGE